MASIGYSAFIVASSISQQSVLLAYFVLKNNTTDLGVAADCSIVRVSKYGGTSASGCIVQNYLPLTGGVLTGNLEMSTNQITGLGTPVDPNQAATKGYVDSIPAPVTVPSWRQIKIDP